MSLRDAVMLDGQPVALPGEPPYPCSALTSLRGRAFVLTPGDPRLPAIHEGGAAPTPPLDNLVGAVRYWQDHPDWMELLDPASPAHQDKMVERGMYLDRWERHLPRAARVLELGGGVGRFTTWLLDRECQVETVDPDLRSLWRVVSSSVGRAGSLDVHWTTGERMPELAPVDVVLAAEVLCYVEDPEQVVADAMRVLRPGGIFLCSVEARWGWVMGPDVHEGTLEQWLDDGIVHAPGDRWVRTYTEASLRRLFKDLDIIEVFPSHYAMSGPFEAAAGPLELNQALALDARLRAHPVAGQLNRAWMLAARKPRA